MLPSAVSVAEAKSQLDTLLCELHGSERGVIITDQGEEAAVLLSIERYRRMMDILEDWEDEHDEELGRRLREEWDAYQRGEGRDFESLARELEL
jgi:prevent-host-death family protein